MRVIRDMTDDKSSHQKEMGINLIQLLQHPDNY